VLFSCRKDRTVSINFVSGVARFRMHIAMLRDMATSKTPGRTKHSVFQPAFFYSLRSWHSAEHLQVCNHSRITRDAECWSIITHERRAKSNDSYVQLGLFALNNAPTVYCDVRKPVIPNHSISLKPASSINLI